MQLESMYSASDLFAIAQNSRNVGELRCHWCGSNCGRFWQHDDMDPVFYGFIGKRQSTARVPSSPFICTGCWKWRKKRHTVFFLSGGLKDGQCAMNHSWWIDDTNAFALQFPADSEALYQFLLHPPLRFCLALRVDAPNALHLAVVNDFVEIKGDTKLAFTVNNIPHWFSTYELQEAMKTGDSSGRDPGVTALFSLLGPPKVEEKVIEKRGRGRPPASSRIDDGPRRTICASGSV